MRSRGLKVARKALQTKSRIIPRRSTGLPVQLTLLGPNMKNGAARLDTFLGHYQSGSFVVLSRSSVVRQTCIIL